MCHVRDELHRVRRQGAEPNAALRVGVMVKEELPSVPPGGPRLTMLFTHRFVWHQRSLDYLKDFPCRRSMRRAFLDQRESTPQHRPFLEVQTARNALVIGRHAQQAEGRPGRFRLATSPASTGSTATAKTPCAPPRASASRRPGRMNFFIDGGGRPVGH